MAKTLIAKKIQQLTQSERRLFYSWIEGMTVADDREDGRSFAEWLRFHESDPNETIWVFFESNAGKLVGTASLVNQDRDLHAPNDGLVIGGVNVFRELRGQGFGKAIMLWLEKEIDQITCRKNYPIRVLLKADNPIAIDLYQSFGFTIMPGKVDVYEKTYFPRDSK